MGNQTGKLYRIKTDFQIQSVELEYSEAFGRDQFVRLELDAVIGTLKDKGKSTPVRLRDMIRLDCIEEADELQEPGPEPLTIEPEPELDDGDEDKTEGD